MFDVNNNKTLDTTELTKLLFVYCGFTGRELDKRLEQLKKHVQWTSCAPRFGLTKFMKAMDELQIMSDLSPDLFAKQVKRETSCRATSLTAAAHNRRLFERMTEQLDNADETAGSSTARAAPITPRQPASRSFPLSARRGGSGAVTDRVGHRLRLSEEKYKRMATIAQGEMAQEKKAAKQKSFELKAAQKLPSLIQRKTVPDIKDSGTSVKARPPSIHIAPKRFLSVNRSRRASLNGENGKFELQPIGEAPANRQSRPQMAHLPASKAVVQPGVVVLKMKAQHKAAKRIPLDEQTEEQQERERIRRWEEIIASP